MVDTNIQMVRGDTLAFGMEIEGLGQDLASCYFTCKKSFQGENIFQKSIGNGVSKVSDGVYRVRVAPEDTADVEAGNYYYDLQIGVNSDIFTLLRGVLMIQNDVTREV